ncbi:hypothetical protein K458DRAFT_148067 [Lentithecium fluviatile CBS 122367]|uniref:Mso1 N-terminal domain-containing protein n=1 Tax=Lentithecium fluviatile CBS 122367 TaxID=1168545 RepID=A0A6G1JDB9_9PLEO|nr:hypothetical protein K458DRAFT_148067 [Lentithecium fluviatile CBS 122367]
MSSYLNNLLTTTTSRYNSLRRQLLSDEADGDTEDDSHISRVLRAYYTEKGRPFPQWLPPDPKAPQAAPPQMATGRQYGQMGPPQMGRGGGALSDLWDTPAQPQQQEPLSLRRAQGRGGGGRRPMGDSLTPEPQSSGRPLPSQRAGSYQSGPSFRPAEPSPPPSAGSGVTAQERLKARLWGGRSTSPSQSASSSQNTSPAVTPGVGSSGMRSPFGRSSEGGGGGRAPYPDDRSSGGGRQQNQYQMSSNSPWAGNDDPYAPPSGGYSAPQRPGAGGGRVGLPSGPRMR